MMQNIHATEVKNLIAEAKRDPSGIAHARINGSMYRVKLDELGRARITKDGDRISKRDI